MILYKYIEEKYKKSFQYEGIIYLSPLSYYKSVTDNRNDTDEGVKRIIFTPKSNVLVIPQENAQNQLGLPNQIKIQQGGSLVVNTKIPDAYIISTSKRFGRDLMYKFNCNSYFQIIEAEIFALMINNALSTTKKVLSYFWAPVKYLPERARWVRTQEHTNKNETSEKTITYDDYLIKSKRYSGESEYRFVFIVEGAALLERISVKCDINDINKCCKF